MLQHSEPLSAAASFEQESEFNIYMDFQFEYLKDNIGCFKKRFTMVFEMLLCDGCYENVYT
jgi:hypothetical protein